MTVRTSSLFVPTLANTSVKVSEPKVRKMRMMPTM